MEIPLQITLRGVAQSGAVEAAIRDKAAKLEQFHPRITGCRVVVEVPGRHKVYWEPHRSAPNPTDAPRRVLYVTWNRAADGHHRLRVDADKRRSYPPDCKRKAGREYVYRV